MKPLPRRCLPTAIRVFGHHHKDGAPQGIFCANGQCAQCMVIADGLPLKSCAELVAARDAGRAGRRPARAARRRPGCRQRRAIQEIAGAGADHRRRAGGHVGGDRAGQAGHPRAAGRRQAPPGRQAGPANPPLLWLHRCRLRRDARHRHRHPPGKRGAQVRNGRGLAALHRPGRLQRPESWHPQGWRTNTCWSSRR